MSYQQIFLYSKLLCKSIFEPPFTSGCKSIIEPSKSRMKARFLLLSHSFIFIIFIAGQSMSALSNPRTQHTGLINIDTIVSHPLDFEGQRLSVGGAVSAISRYNGNLIVIPGKEVFEYQIKGISGERMQVLTTDPDLILNKTYRVTGIIKLDAGKAPYLIEQEKYNLSGTVSPWVYAGSAIAVLMLSGIILIRIRRRRHNKDGLNINPNAEDFKTIQLSANVPSLIKTVPGKLEIVSGDDTGKTMQIPGFPTAGGLITTIGRANITGIRQHAHIRLDNKTVSRRHAELRYFNGFLNIKNYSETNKTVVGDVQLLVNQEIELHSGSGFSIGEISFRYENG